MSPPHTDAILERVSSESQNRVVVYVLGAALGGCLLIIAFLLGRESSRTAEQNEAEPLAAGPAAMEPTGEAAPSGERRWPEWAELDEWEPGDAEAQITQTYDGRIERHPDGRIVLSNRNLDGTSHSPTATQAQQGPAIEPLPAAATTATNEGDVVAYFQRVDEIRSSNAAADPNAFAMDLVKATMKGSTDGFDELIDDTKRMRSEMAAIEPPIECQAYHRESLTALDDSQKVLETMKNAITSGNIQALTQITQQAGVLQSKAKTLEALRQQILANARR